MALPPNTYRDMFYEPLLTPGLFESILTGGGPAYVDVSPGMMPEPAEAPFVPAPTPAEEFQQRIARAEEMARGMPSPDAGLLPPAAPAPSIQPSAPPIMAAPSVQPSAPPTMQAPSADDRLTRQQILDMYPNDLGLSSLRDGGFSGIYTAPPLQRDPATGLFTNASGQQGFYFTTERNRAANYGGTGGFIAVDPNAQYRMWDERGKNRIVASGTGQEALQNIYNLANQFNKDQGKKANWGIERLNPATGRWERVSENNPSRNLFGKIADIALPVAGALIAGPLGAAAGSGLSSVAQGRSLENTLLRSAISGGASFAGGQLFGGAASGAGAKAGGVAGDVAGQVAGEAAKKAAENVVIDAAGNMILSAAREAVAPSLFGSLAGSAVGGVAGQLANAASTPTQPSQPQQPIETTPEGNPIVVSGSRIPTSNIGADMIGGAFNTALPAVTTIANPASPPSDNEIVVTKPASAQVMEGTLGAGLAAGVPAVTSVATSPAAPEKNSLLDDIIKYYSLGSAGLDLLGGALGGGGAGRMTPYASQLGPMPTFTRGPFTPFGGDYETYGFGPEFNFFGGAPAPTPTGPAMGILPPRANPGFGIV